MKIIPYAEWSRRSRGATPSSHPIGSTLGVTLHWEGPRMGTFSHDRCADKVRGIQGFHRDARGWADIAYNFVVCPHGWIFEGRGIGTTSAANGDTKPNADWYAVCYLGGEGDGLTDDGKAGMLEAVRYLRRNGAGHRVNGHRDHKSTACPGDDIYRWLQTADFDQARPAPALTQSEEDDMSLDESLNVHDPKGNPTTANVTVREALSALVISLTEGEKAAKSYLERAAKSPAKEK